MFAFLRRKKDDEPLWSKLARELDRNQGPMLHQQLVSSYALKYSETQIQRELDRLVLVGLIYETEVRVNEGDGWVQDGPGLVHPKWAYQSIVA